MAQDNTNNPTSSSPSLSASASASAALALSAVRSIQQQQQQQQPPPPQSQPSTRRVPPPCWTHEETSALIESYHEKWYSLRRGNLKANHWQEVADAVVQRCSFANPSKTSVQCRHKIEKLRKRYRTEKQRSLTVPSPHRFNSSWVFFNKMDSMEKGPSIPTPIHSYDQNAPHHADDVYENDEDEEDDQPHQYYHRPITTSNGGGSGSGFRFRIPSGPRSVPVFAKNFSTRGEENPNTNPSFGSNPRFWGGNSASKSGFGGKSGGGGGGKRELDPLGEMVSSIRMLGEGFVKMEQMKMEMAREMEQMRMEMEMKRTEMILDSQQRIVEAFAKEFSAKKKLKRMPPSSESQRVVRQIMNMTGTEVIWLLVFIVA